MRLVNGTNKEGATRKFDETTDTGLKGAAELRTFMENEVELVFDTTKPIVLPENVPFACDKCHHNMDRPLEIEANILSQFDLQSN